MSKFDWFLWISHRTSLRCSKDCNRCLFVVSKIDILWSSWRTASSLNINFEQVIKPFLVLNIYFTFFLSVVDCTFYKSNIRSNCKLLLCHVRVRSSPQELFCKKDVLKNFAKFTGKWLWHMCFPVNFVKFLRTFFLTEHLRWLLLTFQSESTIYSFRTSCSKQAQYLKFKWTVTSWKYSLSNIVQTSFLCYVADFWTPSMKMSSAKEV